MFESVKTTNVNVVKHKTGNSIKSGCGGSKAVNRERRKASKSEKLDLKIVKLESLKKKSKKKPYHFPDRFLRAHRFAES